MKKIFIFSLITLAMYSCTPSGYVIKGLVSDSTLFDHNVFLCDALSDNILDTTIVASDGTFQFTGEVSEDENAFLAYVTVEYSEVASLLVIENGKINVDFKYEDGNLVSSFGGTPMNDSLYILYSDLENYRDTINARFTELGSDMLTPQQEIDNLRSKYIEEYYNSVSSRCNVAFNANKDNVVGLFSLLEWCQYDKDIKLDSLLSGAGEIISGNPNVQAMVLAENRIKMTLPGNPYIDLTGFDASGNSVNLSDFVGKGKLVLIDFWASWCAPCKEEIPFLADVVKKYGNEVSVVGLNISDNIDDFNRVRSEYKMSWPQIIDQTEQTFAMTYGVSAIPEIILIGNDGTILARGIRGTEIVTTIEKYL